MTHNDVKIIQETTLYEGFFSVIRYSLKHKLFSGGWSNPLSRELMLRHRVAAALPYDPKLNQVVLIEQFRIGALAEQDSPWLLELVAGLLESNETPQELIHREMQEEADLVIQDSILICDYWVSPGGTNERVALFCAKVDASNAGGIHGLAEEEEDIRVLTMSTEAAFDAIASGRINNAATIIALQWLQLNLAYVRQKWDQSLF